jgi:hypothetical protein
MTQLVAAVSGDLGDTRIVRLNGVADLTAVTSIQANVTNGNGTTVLAAVVTDATARTVTVQLGTVGQWLDTAAPGDYEFEIQAVIGGKTLTWPSSRQPDSITVRAGR